MVNQYGMPSELFPDEQILTRWVTKKPATLFEQQVRSAALEGYSKSTMPDKELSRFMTPAYTWLSENSSTTSVFLRFGDTSWLATPDKAPFIPSECLSYLTAFYSESRSIAHLIGATSTLTQILYCAEDGAFELPLKQASGVRELLILVIKEGISVKILDTVKDSPSLGDARSLVAVVGTAAQVTMISDHSFASDGQRIEHDRWYCGSGSQVTLCETVTGGQHSWLRKEFKLEEKAQVNYTWIAVLRGTEKAALTTVQEHCGPDSSSQLLVKAALSEDARSFYRGTIMIGSLAPRSYADQQQRALMISSTARVCAIPSLEVSAQQVQCKHGSAAGKINKEELWYLSMRGLAPCDAQRLLLQGFLSVPYLHEYPAILARLQDHTVFDEQF